MADGSLEERVSSARARLEELRGQSERAQAGLLGDALEELGEALEELQVAFRQVDARDDDLLSTTERLEQERRRYADLFDLAPEGYLVTDQDGVLQEANQAALEMLGLRREYYEGLPFAVLFDARGRRQLYGVLDLAAHGEVVRGWQITLAGRQGVNVVASIHCAPKFDEEGRVTFLRWLIHDVGPLVEARHREAAALEQARRRLAELTIVQEATHEVAGVLERSRVLRAIARHASRIRGEMGAHAAVLLMSPGTARVLAHHDPRGQTDYTDRPILLPDKNGISSGIASTRARPWRTADLPEEGRHMAADLNLIQGAIVAIPPTGDEVYALAVASSEPEPFSAEELTMLESLAGIAGIALRNADTYQHEAWLASTDPLTGLPNRRHFERLVAVPHDRGLAILAIDVDNLKALNDAYGHQAGDVALAAVANCLKACLREGDMVARTGGDEFSAILYGADQADAEMVAARMREIMHHVTLTQGEVRVSVGVAVAPTAGDVSAVWMAADEALYAAKAGGRDRVVIRSRMDAVLGRRGRETAWEDTLADVLNSRRGLFAVYQPIVRLSGRSVVAYEGFVRPEGAAVATPVGGLFEAARTMGSHRDLDWLSRRTVLEGARELAMGVPIFVKVTLAMLLDALHDVDQMQLLLSWAGRPPADVVLEISARESVRDPGRLEAMLAAYRAEGFRFAVDHVGEGHQGIDGLTRVLPEFVRLSGRLLHRPRRNPALPAAVAFARAMGATVIAGWIEKESEVRAVAQLEVQLVQGYLIGRPSRSFAGEPVSWLMGRVASSSRRGRVTARQPGDRSP